MKILPGALLALTIVTFKAQSASAQQAPVQQAPMAMPQVRIVDVMPTVDPGTPPEAAYIGLDFLIGAFPRPAWWGRDFDVLDSRNSREFAAQIKEGSAQAVPLELNYIAAYVPRWNEALGLYTVHVRASFAGQNWDRSWPDEAALSFSGALPAPFPQLSTATLPFEVAFEPRPKQGYAGAQLSAPHPSVWVKWVRVFRVQPDEKSGLPDAQYQAEVMLAGRRARKRHSELVEMAQLVDANGAQIQASGGLGYDRWGLGYRASSDFESVPNSIEYAKYRVLWSQAKQDGAPDQWLYQAFGYGDLEPIEITFPVQRDGRLLEGDIAPDAWKIRPHEAK